MAPAGAVASPERRASKPAPAIAAPNPPLPVAPNTLPAGSTHASRPAARISPRSQARASSYGGDQHGRVTPPPGRPPKRASVSTRERRRAGSIAITEVEYIALTSPAKDS